MGFLFEPQAWVALITLTLLEIVLGVDNIIFISILAGRLPEEQRQKGRNFGLALAMITRILLLLSLTWVMGLTEPLFEIFNREISGRNLILLAGGLFLLGKSTHEIHNSLEIPGAGQHEANKAVSFAGVLLQVAIIDLVFSLDSVITAVGLANQIWVMITAIVIAVGIMMVAAKAIGDFVDTHPTFKILALSFLLLVGFSLVGEGFGLHIPKGYIYFAMAFSAGVEVLNMKVRARRLGAPVKLHRATDSS